MYSWDFDAPDGVYKNDLLSDRLYYAAVGDGSNPFCPHDQTWTCKVCFPPLPFWRRVRVRVLDFVDRWRPHFHFGPCPEGDKYD